MSDPLSAAPYQPQKKSIFKRPLFVGCLGIILITLLVLGVGLYWLFTSGKTVITDEIRKEIISEINSSDLPPSQQTALTAEIDRITEGFQSGDISMKQMLLIMENLDQSPAMRLLALSKAKGDPLANREITPEEKEKALRIVQRFVYGVFEERIPESALDELVNPLLENPKIDNNFEDLEFRSNISDEELKAALLKAKDYADRAGIQDTNIDPDIAKEVREVVDRILSQNG